MKKRILSMVLAILMIVTLIPAYAVSDTRQPKEERPVDVTRRSEAKMLAESGEDNARASTLKTAARAASSTDFKYEVEGGYIYFNESTGAITDCDSAVTKAVIPSEINGASVTSIGNWAFEDCSSLTSIKLPNSVTSIGYRAFCSCTSLTSIEIPNSVKSIDYEVFYFCESLTSVALPNSVTSIGGGAFEGCSGLTSIKIPNSVTSIGEYAFRWCESLTSITLPNSVTSIGDYAFSSCSGLTSVEIPNRVTSIGEGVFSDCTGLTSINVASGNSTYSSDNGVLFDKNKRIIIQYPAGKRDASYVIPNSVTSIGASAFNRCKSLTSIEIPNSVKSIGNDAFVYCNSLTSITLPNSVTSIGEWAFSHCDSLTSISIPNSVTSIGERAFYYCESLTSITLPNSVKSIGGAAFEGCKFEGCKSLTSINVASGNSTYSSDNGVLFDKNKRIIIQYPAGKRDAFYVIPNSVTSIAYEAFRGCSGLTSIKIPNSVTSIGEMAFYSCTSLTSIKIPNSVTSIGDSAFDWCKSLTDVYYSGGETQWNAISIGTGNDYLLSAKIHYNCSFDKDNMNNKLSLSNISPNHSGISAATEFELTFNNEVELNKGNIVFHKTGKNIKEFKLAVNADKCVKKTSAKTVRVDISSLDLPDGSYYVSISPKAFKTKDGAYYYGLTDKTTWEFEVSSYLNSDIMQSAKKGHLWWKSDDDSKPAIPNGKNEQYADIIEQWAKNQGINNLSRGKIESILSKPMYLPATDINGSSLLINDKNTTVKQTMEDILFFESVKTFSDKLDKDLKGVIKHNQLSGLHLNALTQERDIYENVLGWYPQINKYLEKRNGGSNIFYSAAAPLAYNGLLTLVGSAEDGYEYTKPLLKANLDSAALKASFSGLSKYSKYSDFKAASKDIGYDIKALKVAYKVKSDGVGAGLKAGVKLGLDMLQTYFEDANNNTLNEIGESWEKFDDFKSAWECCLFLNCSIGAFPMVVDLYNDMYAKVKDSVAACYFIGDYYIREKYPSFYAACFDENGFPSKYNAFTQNDFSDDPIVYNWCAFMDKVTEGAKREDCRQLRYDLVNYIMLLKYAKDFNAAAAKSALVKYISAESNAGKTTQFYTSCPVKVEVYDKLSDRLLATLSSNDEKILECDYGTMYLLGDNNETKCFVLNDGSYYAKIIPYDDGTMNVRVVSRNEAEFDAGKNFSEVKLSSGKEFVLDLNDMQSGLNTADGEEVAKDGYIPTSDAEISGANEVAVGSEITLAAKVLPSIASNKNVSWSSSDPTVAEVDDTGVVRGISEGKATIILTCEDGVTREVEVSVFIPANSLSLSKNQLKMVCGEKIKISSETNENASHKIRWVSNNINVVTVGADGEIYAKAAGDAIVTASIDGIEDDICIRVYDTQFGVEMYQGDDGGNRINILMTNNSCTDTLNKTAYAAIYESGRMIDIQSIAVNIECGEEASRTVLLGDFATGKTYSAVFYTIGETAQPDSVKEIVLVNGDYDAAADTEEALNELPDCHKMPIECNDLIAGAEYTLYVLTDNEGVLTENNIAYIAKRTANAEQNTFVVSLANKFNGKQCYAYIVENNGDLREVTSFEQHEHRYENGKCTICGLTGVTWIPGDLNGDGKVNVMDLIRLKRYLADGTEVVGNADVNGDGKVNVMDLIRLKRYIAGEVVDIY